MTPPSSAQNLVEMLERACGVFARRKALIFGSKICAFEELWNESCRAACAIRQAGARPGERVALLLDNAPEFVFAYFGILMNGSVIVPVNHMFKREEVSHILQDSSASILITSRAYAGLAAEVNTMSENLRKVLLVQDLKDARIDQEVCRQIRERSKNALHSDVAVFLYTSGTTGRPKAAMLTHGNLLSNVRSSAACIHVNSRDAFACFLPLFHSFAATVCMLMPLHEGASIVIMKSPRPIRKLIRMIRKHRVTIFVGIPSLYGIMKDLRLPRWLPGRLLKLLNPLRLAISGAAALPPEVFKGFEKKFRLPLLEGYGLTEASPVVSLNPLGGIRKAGSIGLPIPGVQVKIIDEAGRTLSGQEEGELCVKGGNVMAGYHGKPEDNSLTLKDGWLLTGDMAKIDKDGYIFIMGRKKDMVNVRGLNVYPREIEDVLYRRPEIREAAVIGIPDAHKGEVPKAFVVLKTPGALTEHDIIAYLRQHLADYKVPRKIEIRNELPKNQAGKILKRVLAGNVGSIS
ncbi:MAG: long-chain fatty acid--CoA ligase [Candidatus Omnitrophota bacterium]